MSAMNNLTLPIPNPADWISLRAAAAILNMSTRSVRRMIEAGALTGYRPRGFLNEEPPLMLWRAEVLAVRDARRLLAGTAADQ